MKTAQRILVTALTMFNEHGENTVTSVDIAVELDISPGNLYYHFKGKDSLVTALMKMHEQQMQKVLRADKLDTLHAEDIMYYLYLILDTIHVFRFFYRSPADLVEKYPSISRPRANIQKQLRFQLAFLFDSLSQRNVLVASNADRTLLVDLALLIITQSCQYDELNNHSDDELQRFHALSLMMVAIVPRLTLSDDEKDNLEQVLKSHEFVKDFKTQSLLDFA